MRQLFPEPRRAEHAPLAGGTAPRKAAGDARAGRPSCLKIAAALPRCQSRQSRRRGAAGRPRGRLVASGGSRAAARRAQSRRKRSWRRRRRRRRPCRRWWRCWRSSWRRSAAANRRRERQKWCRCQGRPAHDSEHFRGKVRRRALQGGGARLSAHERRPPQPVPPCAKDVLRCPLLPQPARCERLERDRSAHAIGTLERSSRNVEPGLLDAPSCGGAQTAPRHKDASPKPPALRPAWRSPTAFVCRPWRPAQRRGHSGAP